MKKRMGCKACDESKPQQPYGCEDLDEEYNEADRLLFAPHQSCCLIPSEFLIIRIQVTAFRVR